MTEWDFYSRLIDIVNGPEFGNRFLLLLLIVLIILTAIQFSKIPLKPWSNLARAIGRSINREYNDKMQSNFDALNHRVDLIEKNQEAEKEARELNEALTARVRILRFQSELLKGEKHTLSEFNQALEDIDCYEKYCRTHPEFPNNRAVESISNIKRCYRKAEEDRDFMPEAV